MSFTMKCPKCNQINDSDNIDVSTRMNEEGEEYYEFDFTCGSCLHEIYKGSGWGEFDLNEAIEEINESFSDKEEVQESNGEKSFISIGDSILLMGGINDYSEKTKIRILGCSCFVCSRDEKCPFNLNK